MNKFDFVLEPPLEVLEIGASKGEPETGCSRNAPEMGLRGGARDDWQSESSLTSKAHKPIIGDQSKHDISMLIT